MPATIPQLIHQLADSKNLPHCTNPYGYERPFSAQRRHNLQTYLTWMALQQPTLLLIGEAPGYRGCRLTGIPFTSPHILADFGARFLPGSSPFQSVAEWPDIVREASATIVWQTIGSWQPLPLLWNIFPFHPHQPDRPQTNRTPTACEIATGRPFLDHLRSIFPQTQVVAVGKKAAHALASWDVDHTAVRHPAHGGARQFQAALNRLR